MTDYDVRFAASTYAAITRDEFEDWLNSLGFRGKWRLKPGRGGVYQVRLSDNVALEINSTTGSADEVMGVGQASMSVKLVSTLNGRTLNRKAQGQSHFARTVNWRKNWAVGVDRMRDAYMKAKDFYDNIARIEDLEAYKRDTLAAIEAANPNWRADQFLSDLHDKVEKGGVLTGKQEAALQRPKPPAPTKAPVAPEGRGGDPRLPMLRDLYVRARSRGDEWSMEFTKSVAEQIKAGRTLSPKQEAALDRLGDRYKVDLPRTASLTGWTFAIR
jgi:hypothetical protein